MDGTRFDALTKVLSAQKSRRAFLATVAASLLGLNRHDPAGARSCTNPGAVCREHANCCSGLCGPRDATGRHRCLCKTAADCPGANKVCTAAGICATPSASTTTSPTTSTSTTSTTTSTTSTTLPPTTTTTTSTTTSSTTSTTTSTTTPAPGCTQTVCGDGSCRGGAADPCSRPRECCSGNCLEDACVGDAPTCDCSNLNFCSSNGICTPVCTCDCDDPYTGADCSQLPTPTCADFTDCTECNNQPTLGCVFCDVTSGGATDVCVTSDQCLVPQDGCLST